MNQNILALFNQFAQVHASIAERHASMTNNYMSIFQAESIISEHHVSVAKNYASIVQTKSNVILEQQRQLLEAFKIAVEATKAEGAHVAPVHPVVQQETYETYQVQPVTQESCEPHQVQSVQQDTCETHQVQSVAQPVQQPEYSFPQQPIQEPKVEKKRKPRQSKKPLPVEDFVVPMTSPYKIPEYSEDFNPDNGTWIDLKVITRKACSECDHSSSCDIRNKRSKIKSQCGLDDIKQSLLDGGEVHIHCTTKDNMFFYPIYKDGVFVGEAHLERENNLALSDKHIGHPQYLGKTIRALLRATNPRWDSAYTNTVIKIIGILDQQDEPVEKTVKEVQPIVEPVHAVIEPAEPVEIENDLSLLECIDPITSEEIDGVDLEADDFGNFEIDFGELANLPYWE
jgi:hypothetical protein